MRSGPLCTTQVGTSSKGQEQSDEELLSCDRVDKQQPMCFDLSVSEPVSNVCDGSPVDQAWNPLHSVAVNDARPSSSMADPRGSGRPTASPAKEKGCPKVDGCVAQDRASDPDADCALHQASSHGLPGEPAIHSSPKGQSQGHQFKVEADRRRQDSTRHWPGAATIQTLQELSIAMAFYAVRTTKTRCASEPAEDSAGGLVSTVAVVGKERNGRPIEQ